MKGLQNGTYCVNYQQDKTISMADIAEESLNENFPSSSSIAINHRSTISPNFVEKVRFF
jgi:hypothetical protein